MRFSLLVGCFVLCVAAAQAEGELDNILTQMAPEHGIQRLFYDLDAGPLPGFAGIYYDWRSKTYVLAVVPNRANGLLRYVDGESEELRVGTELQLPERVRWRIVETVEAAGFHRPNPRYRVAIARYSFKQLWDWGSLYQYTWRTGAPSVNEKANKLHFYYYPDSYPERDPAVEARILERALKLGIPRDAIWITAEAMPEPASGSIQYRKEDGEP